MWNADLRELIERVRERSDIVQVIGNRISLNRNYKALCPFHKEKKPSFSVNPRGQYFHCFGCGVGGDVFRFIERYENKSFWEVFSDLAREVGVPLSVNDGQLSQIEESRRIEDILTATADFYFQSLTVEARKYLIEERGLSEDTIRRFKIGYACGGLKEHLTQVRKFPEELCLKAGVLKQADRKSVRDYFFRRIVFPNFRGGSIVHLSGRSLDGGEPKYLHLPGEIHYLFNESALWADEVLVTGSPTDLQFRRARRVQSCCTTR